MEDRITVAQALELGVAITWQQAVAITLEAWHVSVNAEVRERPVHLGPESCVLTVQGDVLLPRPALGRDPGNAQQLLRALLDGVHAPPELVDIAFGARPTFLSDDLAAFSRPNRRVEIVDVASRAVTALAAMGLSARDATAQPRGASAGDQPTPAVAAPTAPAPSEPPLDAFEKLRQQAAERPAAPAAPQPPRPAPSRARWAPVLLGAASMLAVLVAWRAWTSDAPIAVPADAPPPAVIETTLEASPPDPSWFAAGRRDLDIALPRSATSTSPRARPTPSAAAGIATGVTSPGSPTAEPSAALVAGDSALPVGTPETVPSFPAEDTVYSWASEGVTPPTMIFPRMPRTAFPEPDAVIDGRPYLEVLVNDRGDVDAVRLRGNLSSADLVRHGMMLAPAKAWHFAPATLDGRPVRYVVRVLVGQ